jgi:hypothetical protein
MLYPKNKNLKTACLALSPFGVKNNADKVSFNLNLNFRKR